MHVSFLWSVVTEVFSGWSHLYQRYLQSATTHSDKLILLFWSSLKVCHLAKQWSTLTNVLLQLPGHRLSPMCMYEI